jgi:predicted ATP-dependent protease
MRHCDLTHLSDRIETTAEVLISKNPLEAIIGQDHAVSLVKSAVAQRRHVLLCGVPGIGKSMLAKAAYSLLPPPRTEIRIRRNLEHPERPLVEEYVPSRNKNTVVQEKEPEISYVHPDDLPFEVASKMGYRCPKCGAFSVPSESTCWDCGRPKRSEWSEAASYVGLLRELDVISAPALTSVSHIAEDGRPTIYRRSFNDTIMVIHQDSLNQDNESDTTYGDETLRVLVPYNSSRFVRVSGFSPVELLGDVKHDPYGGAESLGIAAHMRVVPGAIHEAHEGILYIDEIAALGEYQKHLLTAMQDRKFAISAHNPQSSGAAVRVDDVPCDFLLFAACNIEDLPRILPPLRSRIRGYGYEIMLRSWMEKSEESIDKIIRFIAQTVSDDGRIPHFGSKAVLSVLTIAEEMARSLDGQRDALTLRLRELGGVIRIAGDIAVQEGNDTVLPEHVERAGVLSQDIESQESFHYMQEGRNEVSKSYGDYFF